MKLSESKSQKSTSAGAVGSDTAGRGAGSRESINHELLREGKLGLEQLQQLCEQGYIAEALEQLEAVAEKDPDAVDGQLGLAMAYQFVGQHRRALDVYERALRRVPNNPHLRMQRAMLLLRTGDYRRGWPEYEWRLRVLKITRSWIDRAPLWDGSPIPNQTLLVHAEQGLGDTLQFVRFLPRVRELVGRTMLLCQARLGPLLKQNQVADEIIVGTMNEIKAERYVALGSLPGLFKFPGTDSSNRLNPQKYLSADQQLVDRWRPRIRRSEGLRVGLVWSGSTLHRLNQLRSIPLSAMVQLASVPGVQLFSLQKEIGKSDPMLAQDSASRRGTVKLAVENDVSQELSKSSLPAVVDFGEELDRSGPFMDTAAILENLDLVITIDSSVAHLAAALGRPTWILLPELADWRWQLTRSDSVWYDSVRLFRKQVGQPWEALIRQVAEQLRATSALSVPACSTNEDD